ncbi:MAG: CPBP family intramembrane metalloprotease [Myxococcales bacterium]|nr:CPBP family intramembrane metalloprotease [Myxococcales bacterium]
MRASIIRTFVAKEIRETLRDKRTLFTMILLPIVLYPGMMLLISQVAAVQVTKMRETKGRIAISGGAIPASLARELLRDETLRVVELPREPRTAIRARKLEVWIVVPPDSAKRLGAGGTIELEVYYDQANDISRDVHERVQKRIEHWRKLLIEARLRDRGLPVDTIRPLRVTSKNLAPPHRVGGYVLAQFLPMLIMLTVILGAFHPAIDLTAGEKERGTLQTLLTAPIRSTEIVTGKFLAVVAIAFFSGFFNVVSLALVFSHNLALSSVQVDLRLSLTTILLLFVVVIVMGLFFASLMLTVAVLARSYKEAQTYLTPVYLICIVPVIVAQLPGFELSRGLAVVPAVNVALLLKQILLGRAIAEHYFVVISTSLLYTVLVLLAAARIFAEQSILLGQPASLRALLGNRGGSLPERPTIAPAEAVTAVAVIFILLYYVGSWLQHKNLIGGLLLSQYLLLALPVVLLLVVRRADPVDALALRLPSWRGVAGVVALGLSSWVILVGWQELQNRVLPLPRELLRGLDGLVELPRTPQGIALLFFGVALTPAICEELVFRGLLFSALARRLSGRATVALTAVAFGLFHLSIHRFVGTAFLGLLMGLAVWRTGSIVSSMLFHALHNGVVLALSLWGRSWLAWQPGEGFPPKWSWIVGACGFVLGLALLARARPESQAGADERSASQ